MYIVHTKVSDKNLAPFSKYHTAEQKAEYVTTPCRTTVTITAKKYTEFFFLCDYNSNTMNSLCTYGHIIKDMTDSILTNGEFLRLTVCHRVKIKTARSIGCGTVSKETSLCLPQCRTRVPSTPSPLHGRVAFSWDLVTEGERWRRGRVGDGARV